MMQIAVIFFSWLAYISVIGIHQRNISTVAGGISMYVRRDGGAEVSSRYGAEIYGGRSRHHHPSQARTKLPKAISRTGSGQFLGGFPIRRVRSRL